MIGWRFPLAFLVGSWCAAASAAITHVFVRDPVVYNFALMRPDSSGETLYDGSPWGPEPAEGVDGDLEVEVRWSDGHVAKQVWRAVSGKSRHDAGPVLYPGLARPGVSFDDGTGAHLAFLEQSGDTYAMPWELRNQGSVSIAEVILSARGGSPFVRDMGFDTNSGDNPGHGDTLDDEEGFLLTLDALSQWSGDMTVTYDWANGWLFTTDMFHRMTLSFAQSSHLPGSQSLVFRQDTDELSAFVPTPGSAFLALLALVGLRPTSRQARSRARRG